MRFLVCLLLAIILLGCAHDPNIDWDKVRADHPLRVAEGWSMPVRLNVSEDGTWADSVFVTLDGSTIYYMFYPGDLFTAMFKTGKFESNAQIFRSDAPFTTKVKETRYHLSDEPPWSSAGPSITADGDVFYHSNRPHDGDSAKYLSHIYLGDGLLPFNSHDLSYNNPQYCPGKDELWFDHDDKEIYVLKNAKANNYTGTPELAPKPINSYTVGVTENQPWLSQDCERIFFTSNRDEGLLAIYTSRRNGDGWLPPKKVVQGDVGVGEATLTADESKLFFLVVLKSGDVYTTNMYYTERK